MNPNPYESPQVEQPLKRSQVVKRGLGLAAILLLTPPAMIVAVLTCCTVGPWFPAARTLIVFGGPLTVLAGLMTLAAYDSRPRKDDPNSTRPPIRIFIATPIFVALAVFTGFLFGALMYFATHRAGGHPISGTEWFPLIAFWLPPVATLLYMLRLAWRSR